MIQNGAKCRVLDNSGAKQLRCLRVFRKKKATVGDRILGALQKTLSQSKTKVKKGEVRQALVVGTRAPIKRKDGSSLSFHVSSVVLLNPQGFPLGKRIPGIVPYELRKYPKVFALSGNHL